MGIGSSTGKMSETVPGVEAPDEALVGLNRLATVARLLSGAVHEVNNALQVITGTVEVLETRSDLPQPVGDALARVRGQSNRAAAALAQVLLFTRAERQGRVPVNVREVVEESLALRDFAIRRARLTARVEADPSAAFVVTINRGDLQQAVLNLIINAEQALSGTAGEILLQISREGDATVIRVIDSGRGIAVEPPERAFDPFVTTQQPFEGAGLGLWAARLLIEQHGGTLTAERHASRTAFVVRLNP